MKLFRLISFYIYIVLVIGVAFIFSASCWAPHRRDASIAKPTPSENALDINTSSAEELKRIPGLGLKLAGEIVRFRERHGPFRRPEHLLLIHGMSDRRYREISVFVKTD